MNPPDGVTFNVNVADWPAVMVPEVGATEREKSAAMLEPAPVRLTVCGLPEVLSVARRLPVRVPDAVGENVTLMAQFPPTAKEPPQLLV